MTDKKKNNQKADVTEMEMPDMEMPMEYMPAMQHMCPMMSGAAMQPQHMCPMMSGQVMQPPCMSMGPYMSEPMYDKHEMRVKDWYEEDDSDYSSDESDDYPHFYWKPKYKHPVYPWLWPTYIHYPPYHKKHKK